MNVNTIKEKEKKIIDCIRILKEEFIGIDDVIDQVMDNIKSWYIYPELTTRPIVINLWGMTGCGKTSLVNRICTLLDVNENKIYYNLAKLGEDSSDDMEYMFDDILLKKKDFKTVFIFDEFQYAASISSDNKEKEPVTALKTIWEIIDSGKIQKALPKSIRLGIKRVKDNLNIIIKSGAVIENNIWTNSKECIEKIVSYQKADIFSLFNTNFEIPEMYVDSVPSRYWSEVESCSFSNNKNFFLSCESIGILYDAAVTVGKYDGELKNFADICLMDKSICEIADFVELLYKEVSKDNVKDYSKSIVFVMGNIDEAYSISYNVDPDMDPDQFNAITKKLNVIDLKSALQRRFRNEQIARLGSIMILYPSFTIDSFNRIIQLQLDNYSKNVKDILGIEVVFDKSINELIYKDGVFPTQGTRPVLASTYEIAQTKAVPVLLKAIEKNYYEVDKIEFSCTGNIITAKAYKDGKFLFDTEFEQILRIENLRNNITKEQQALTAVHESGHFVLYSMLTGKIPAKLISVAASSGMGGFMLEDVEDIDDFMTYQDYLNEIKIDLAGYAAEMVVFGKDNITSGAELDLRNATTTASKMLREYAMDRDSDSIMVSTYLDDAMSTDCGLIVKNTDVQQDKINDSINKILKTCLDDVINVLSNTEWKKMFIKSCNYLKNYQSMPEEKMKSIYRSVDKKIRETAIMKSNNRFSKALDNFCKTK